LSKKDEKDGTDETGLTTREETLPAVALPEGYLDDFPEGYDEKDHVIPWVTIVQPNSHPDKKAGRKDGQFTMRDGTAYDALRFVVIRIHYGRGKKRPFEGHDKGGSMWACWSDNRRLGFAQDPRAILGELALSNEPQYIECVSCPLHDDEDNRVSKGCRYAYVARCWDTVGQQPFALLVSGSAVPALRPVIIDKVTPRKTMSGLVFDRPFWWAEFEMTTVHRSDKGSYYVPVPRMVRELEPGELEAFAAVAGIVKTQVIEEPEADEDEAQRTFDA
jgi:hypothetical protein